MSSLLSQFELRSGTAIGWKHQLRGTNNQDASRILIDPKAIVAVVADGCSGSPHSEVGAKVGSSILADLTLSAVQEGRFTTDNLSQAAADAEMLRLAFIASLNRLVRELVQPVARKKREDRKANGRVIQSYFFFTTIVAVVAEPFTTLFTFGDGIVAVNGHVSEIKFGSPLGQNLPPYIGHHLKGLKFMLPKVPEHHQFQIQHVLPTADVQSLLIGTDGVVDLMDAENEVIPGCKKRTVGPLSQLWQNAKFAGSQSGNFGTDSAITVWLRSLGGTTARRVIKPIRGAAPPSSHGVKYPRLMSDDTTLVVINRKH